MGLVRSTYLTALITTMCEVGKFLRNIRAVFSRLYLMYALLSWCTCMFSGKSCGRQRQRH